MAKRFTVEAVFKAIDRISAPVTRMQNRLGKATRSINRGFKKINKTIKGFARGVKRAGTVAVASLAGIGFAMLDIITIGADFSRALGAAAAKFPGDIKRGTAEFKAMRDAAREVGKTTEFTSVQAAQGLNFLAKAGFSVAFSMKMLKPIVDFATASELEFAEAADIASDALGAFGLDSDNLVKKMAGMTRVMDVMSKAAASSNQSVTELFESAKKSAPLATAAGVSIETFSAAMAVLASNGIKASVAGTAAKNVTLALAGATTNAAKALKRLGVATSRDGKLRDQIDVLDDLREAMKSLTEQQQIVATREIFGRLSIASAAILLSDAGKKVRILREEFENAGGASAKMAAFIRDDVRGSIDGLKSAIEGVKISIFTMNEGPLKDVIDRMTDWVRLNEELIATNVGGFMADILNNIDGIAATVVTFAKWTAGILAAIVALKSLALILSVVNLIVAANPIVLIILAAVAAVGLLIAAWNRMKDVFTFDNLFDDFKRTLDKIKETKGTIDAVVHPLGIRPGAIPRVAGPQERAASSIIESRNTESSEVTIRDETGRAEITKGKFGPGLSMPMSGAF